MSQRIKQVVLTSQEVNDIQALLDRIFSDNAVLSSQHFFFDAHLFAQELPLSIRRLFLEFKLGETCEGICIKGTRIDDAYIGVTPGKVPQVGEEPPISREEALQVLYASLLGECVGWSTQQSGRVINEIIPLEENEVEIVSSGSRRLFDLHTEIAFHPYSPDYLALMCMRNPDRSPTIVAGINEADLDDTTKDILFEPRFVVGANFAYREAKVGGGVPILFGSKASPYIRVNLNSQRALNVNDMDARRALDTIAAALVQNVEDIVLEPGDYFYLDNFRVAHGRRAFTPRYDGTDRWLKRLTITSYLRKSRDRRERADSYVIQM